MTGPPTASSTHPPASAWAWLLDIRVIVVVAWAEAALIMLTVTAHHPGGLSLSFDNALRLVQIRDLLAGQSWFDLTLYRIAPPHGLPMHWTRVVDGPIALLIISLRTVLPAQAAETVAISAWPLLLLLAALFAIVRIATRLGGRGGAIAALLLAVSCLTDLGGFWPGHIDQDNLQIVLTLWSLALLIDFRISSKAPPTLAIIAAISLATGLETIPFQLLTALTVGGWWAWDGPAVSRAVRRFGTVLAGTALLLSFTVIAPHERYSAACDTFSGLFSILTICGGTGLASLTLAPVRTRLGRGIAVAALAGLLFAILLTINPQCLAGPYGTMDPALRQMWLSHIVEARTPFSYIADNPAIFISRYVYACVCLTGAVTACLLLDGKRREAAAILCLFAAAALITASFQIRAAQFAILLAVPGLAAAITTGLQKTMRPDWKRAIAMIATLVLFSNVTFALTGMYSFKPATNTMSNATVQDPLRQCSARALAAAMKTLPPGQVISMLDFAPTILLDTPDSVLAGNYHRGIQGIEDTYRFFTGPPAAAAAIARRRGIDYIILCSGYGEFRQYRTEGGPASLSARLEKGPYPPWIEPVKTHAGNWRIYRILKGRLHAAIR